MTIEYTGEDGKTEFAARLFDIRAFAHQGDIFYIILGAHDISWVEVSEGCYEFVKSKWLDYAND